MIGPTVWSSPCWYYVSTKGVLSSIVYRTTEPGVVQDIVTLILSINGNNSAGLKVGFATWISILIVLSGLGFTFSFVAIALIILVCTNVIFSPGAIIILVFDSLGFVPSIVYYIDAPGVSQMNVNSWDVMKIPVYAGLKVGASTIK